MEFKKALALVLLAFFCLSTIGFAQNADLVFPKNRQFLDVNPHLTWNSNDSATAYRLLISRNASFNPNLVDQIQTEQSFQSSLGAGSYHWMVIHLKSSQAIDSSELGQFNVMDLTRKDSLKLWLRADSNVTESMNQVSGWKDLSAAGIQLTQSNSNRQSTLVPNAINGMDALYFDPSQDFFVTPAEIKSRNYIIAAIYNFRENSNRATRAITGTTNWLMGPYTSFYRIFAGNGLMSSVPVVENQYVLHTAFSRNDTLHNMVNNVDYDTKVNSNVPGRLNIGRQGGDHFHGNFAEIVMLSGSSSDAALDSINSYLMDRYAPPVNLGENQLVCSFPQSLSAERDTYLSYTWNTGSSDSIIQINAPGTYTVTVSDIFGRVTVDSVQYDQDLSNYQVDFGFSDSTICLGSSLSLSAGLPIYTYTWNTGDTSFQIQADSNIQYRVQVENCLGSLSFDTLDLTLNEPRFSLGSDTSICFNSSLQLFPDSTFNQVSYLWSNGSTAPSITVDTAKSYGLKVIDFYQCSFSDTLLLDVDSSLFPMDLGPDTNLCIGNSIGLVQDIPGISSYLWSNGVIDPELIVDSASNYHLRIEKDGCINRDTIAVSIKGDAPFANFSIQKSCFLEHMEFVDLSSAPLGDTVVAWKWYFGDGDSSLSSNPSHQYDTINRYWVDLKVRTNRGCEDTTRFEVEVFPKPTVDFESNSYCSKRATNFFDRSTISSGTVVSYLWNFGDTASGNNISTDRKPSHIYDTLGLYQIQLVSQSDRGCKDTLVKSQLINPSPNISLTYSGTCFGDSTEFSSNATVASDSIFDYYWLINTNFVSVAANPVVKLPVQGNVLVSVSVRSDSLCRSVINDSIRIFERPEANFISDSNCVGAPFQVQNTSSISSDSITSFEYLFNQTDTSLLENPIFQINQAGEFPLKLRITSSQSCPDSIEKMVFVSELPKPQFSLAIRESGVPFHLVVENESTQANQYSWSFGNGDRQDGFLPNYTYIDTGSFVLQLKARNEFQCMDSLSQTIRAIPYFLDASIGRLLLSETPDGRLKLSARLLNTGSNTIDSMNLEASFADQFSIEEEYTGAIYRGGQDAFEFSGSFIQSGSNKIDYACVRILKVNGVQDQNSDNNAACEPGFRGELFVDLYPNPVQEQLQFNFVLPDFGSLFLQFYDQLGRPILEEINQEREAGVYRLVFDLGDLQSGIYHYSLRFNGTKRSGTFIKQ